MTEAPVRAFAWVRRIRRAVRAWRRITFTSGGTAFTAGTFAVGFAAMNTGNNLLYMLLGAMLGFIVVSGWLSEQAIRGVRVERHAPRSVTVGNELRIGYVVENAKPRLPSLAIELSEAGLPGKAFAAHVPPGGTAHARAVATFVRRGIHRLGTVTLSTGFPFGMFRKERDLEIPGEVVVWPRADRSVAASPTGSGRIPHSHGGPPIRGVHGHRGEYRTLRSYRAGDDPRDIHWRSSARLREPVIREYERDGGETRWICLDLRSEPGDAAEVAVEVAASLAAQAMGEGRSFALAAGGGVVSPGEGAGQLERVLDALARVDFTPTAPPPHPPVDPETCVLVSVDGQGGFGAAVTVGRAAIYDVSQPRGAPVEAS